MMAWNPHQGVTMGLPTAKMPNRNVGYVQQQPKPEAPRNTERDLGERITQADYIYDPVFTPLFALVE